MKNYLGSSIFGGGAQFKWGETTKMGLFNEFNLTSKLSSQ